MHRAAVGIARAGAAVRHAAPDPVHVGAPALEAGAAGIQAEGRAEERHDARPRRAAGVVGLAAVGSRARKRGVAAGGDAGPTEVRSGNQDGERVAAADDLGVGATVGAAPARGREARRAAREIGEAALARSGESHSSLPSTTPLPQQVPLIQVPGAVQVPQLPPHSSSPQSLPVQSGVQHTPNFAPDALTHTPLFPLVPQQLRLVRHLWPSALHGPAVASRSPASASATTASRAMRSPRTCFMDAPLSRARGGPPRHVDLFLPLVARVRVGASRSRGVGVKGGLSFPMSGLSPLR